MDGRVARSSTRSPGGVYRVEVIPGNVARGVFVELDPPRRLVYTWGWEAGAGGPVPPGSTTIEIDLVPDGDGTTVHFTHRDLPDRLGRAARARLGPLPRALRRGRRAAASRAPTRGSHRRDVLAAVAHQAVEGRPERPRPPATRPSGAKPKRA